MKAKDEAKKLTLSFIDLVHTEDNGAKSNMKDCALICVDEMQKLLIKINGDKFMDMFKELVELKQEIERL